MASWQQEIQVGQSIWWNDKNGYIDGVDYQRKTVFVSFYDKGRQTFEFDDLIGSWDDSLNQWVVAPL